MSRDVIYWGGLKRVERELLDLIEELRLNLYELGATRNLNDLEVISISQRLDSVLNQYHSVVG